MQNPWVLQQCVYRGYSQTDGCMIVRLRVHIHEYIYVYIYAVIYISICTLEEHTTNIGYIPSSHV